VYCELGKPVFFLTRASLAPENYATGTTGFFFPYVSLNVTLDTTSLMLTDPVHVQLKYVT